MLKRSISYLRQGVAQRYFASELEVKLHQVSEELAQKLGVKSFDNLKIVDESELEARRAKGENVVSRKLWQQLFPTAVTTEEMQENLKALEEAAKNDPYY